MNEESELIVYLRQIFPKISESKMREGIFIGAQVKQIFTDHDFSTKLNATERQPQRHLKTSAETFQSMKKRKITVKLCSS
jgi:hypothetical protein